MLRLINQLVSQAIRTWSLVEGIHQAPVHFPMLYQALFIEHDPNWSRRTFSIHVNFCTLPSSSFSEYQPLWTCVFPHISLIWPGSTTHMHLRHTFDCR